MKLALNVGRYQIAWDSGQGLKIRNESWKLSEAVLGSALYEMLTGGAMGAGRAVNERTAMQSSAVYACVSLLAGLAACTPWGTFERRSDDDKAAIKHDYWWLFNEQPNEAHSAPVFWEWLFTAYLLSGDMFALIGRDRNGRAREIFPLDPRSVVVTKSGNRLVYAVYPDEGPAYKVQQEDMIHVPCVGFDGRRGMSPIRAAGRMAIGINLAADDYAAQFFQNSARPDFLLQTPGPLSEEAGKKILQAWMEKYPANGGKAHLPAILTNGLTAQQMTMSSEDAQLLETRQWQVIEICRIYGVPPVLVGEVEKTSSWGTGVAQMGTNLGKFTLQRHLVKVQAELNRKLFYTSRYYFEFNMAGLERGDIQGRYEAYKAALGGSTGPGFMTPNEARKRENLPPIEGGDKLTTWERKGDEKQSAATAAR